MNFQKKKYRLGDILVQQGIITAEQLATALTEQQKDRRRLGDYLVENGITTDEDIALA
ncbi:MAG TPA: type II secretion system protein GspE, partial [Clostridiales bacterium]|nr:type II secretion system protein GspE [Clostridiales bacterium]